MKSVFYTFIMMFLVAVSCTNGEHEFKSLDQAMETRPDSVLKRLDELSSSYSSMSKSEKMHYILLKAEAMNKLFIPMDTLQHVDEMCDYYMSHGSSAEKLCANYMMGSVYRDRNDAPSALQYYSEAIRCADTTDAQCDYKTVARVYGQMEEMYRIQRYPQKVKEMAELCYHYAKKGNATLLTIQAFERIGSAYHLIGNDDSTYYYLKEANKMYLKNGFKQMAAASKGGFIDLALRKGDLRGVKSDIDDYVRNSGFFDKDGNIDSTKAIFLSMVGDYYLQTAQLDSANYYYRKSITYKNDIGNLENGYRGLMMLYCHKGLADSVAKFAQLYADANDTANIRNSALEVIRMKAMYDYTEKQNIAAQKTREAANLKLTLIVCIVIVALIICVVCHKIKVRAKIHKEKLAEERAAAEEAQRIANDKYTQLHVRVNELKNDLQQSHSDYVSYVAAKTKEIEQLKKELASLVQNSNIKKWETEQLMLNHDCVMHAHEIAYKGQSLSDSEWNDLRCVIENFLPDFCTKIATMTQELKDQERKICYLTKLRFSPGEIVSLLSLSSQRVTNLRAALNLKLFNTKGSKSFSANIESV